ncbi:C39 family peptidase [Myxococcota bacterium]|nr:C39 family peptidase [Myxococcota bacterium]
MSFAVRPSFVLSLFVLGAPAPLFAAEARPSPPYASVFVDGAPHVEQRPDFCGEACAEMALRRLGVDVSQDEVFALSGVDPALGRGVVTDELKRALERLGFDVGPTWRSFATKDERARVEAEWRALHADLTLGVPSIVCMRYDDRPNTTEHFRLVLGYDATTDEVRYHEPAEPDGADRRMARALFLKLWTFRPTAERRTLIRLRLDPRDLRRPANQTTAGPTPAELAQHVMTLKEKVRGERFTIAVVPPFVVIGDVPPAELRGYAEGTVRWTMDLLKKDFFERDPSERLDVWIFANERSYRRHAKALFGDEPETPYGYFSAQNRALVMNIGPGSGTLVHELVHPYMHANYPDCPPWLNEGLASLFERPAERKGHLVGRVNWRLPTLQTAIRGKWAPKLEHLFAMDEHAFYDDDTGVHYAAARYVAYALQERGLLARFVRDVIAAKDTTGIATLKAVLGTDDLAAFQKTWEAEVLELRYERR